MARDPEAVRRIGSNGHCGTQGTAERVRRVYAMPADLPSIAWTEPFPERVLAKRPGPLSSSNGTAVDWWFAFKPTTAAFPRCSTAVSCLFGGEAMPQSVEPMFGLQYILASSFNGSTSPMQLHSDCLGNGEDPLAKTFQQVYSGQAPNFVLWNDQFYDDPDPDITPPCALQRASVVTDPKNSQLMKLSGGPTNLQQAARELGQQAFEHTEIHKGR
eukprot:g23249.t1